MKQYYTLIQEFTPALSHERRLGDYLTDQGIKYEIGADFAEEFRDYGYHVPGPRPGTFMSKCVALIEEHELSAIMLSLNGVTVVRNRSFINLKNKIRRQFKWFP